jgi:hypothetical protein
MEFIKQTYIEYLSNILKTDYETDYKILSDILTTSDYLDTKIYNNIINTIKNRSIYNYEFCNTKVQFYFCYDKVNIKLQKAILFYINFLIYFYNKLKPLNRELRIIIIDYKGKKELGDKFTPFNINSGVSIKYNDTKGDVIIYRREELFKVLAHELIHFFDLDLKQNDSKIETKLNKVFQITCKSINLNES